MNDERLRDTSSSNGQLWRHVSGFGQMLRRAGLPIGPGHVMAAMRAVAAIDIARRDEFYWALHAALVVDHCHSILFKQAFGLFWREPNRMQAILSALLPSIDVPYESKKHTDPVLRRIDEAMQGSQPSRTSRASRPDVGTDIEFDAAMTYARREQLRTKDFEQMSSDEVRAAKAAIARMRLPVAEVVTRRYRPDPRGARVDLRAMLRARMRTGGALMPLRYRSRQRRPPPVVILCDISGSMERYSRMLLHFMHVLTMGRQRTLSLVFGTRLTDITRSLRDRDVDLALNNAGKLVRDWGGGTRIGACLRTFNHVWGRRMLGQGAVVLLITDGLDRDGADGIDAQMVRLKRSCRRLIWLNPLLRYAGFEPRAAGIRAILAHVDEHRPVHNLRSLEQLAQALGSPHRR